MDDKKFDEMMNDWAEREQKSAPQLRPTKEMYQMVKAKRPRVWFPVFARWATVGVAAALIVIVAMLHPGLVPFPPFQDTASKQETAPTEPKDESEGLRDDDAAEPSVPSVTETKPDTSQAQKKTLREPEMPVERISEDAPPADGAKEEQYAVADKMAENIPAGEEMTLGSPVADDLADKRALSEEIAQAQPEAEIQESPPAPDPLIRSRKITEVRKPKEEPSPEKEAPPLSTVSIEADEEASSELSTSRALRMAVSEKRSGEKTFHLKDHTWVDAEYTQEQELLTIKRDSQAYHDALAAIPELREYLDIGEFVIVVLGDYALEIAAEGKTALTDEELEKLSESLPEP